MRTILFLAFFVIPAFCFAQEAGVVSSFDEDPNMLRIETGMQKATDRGVITPTLYAKNFRKQDIDQVFADLNTTRVANGLAPVEYNHENQKSCNKWAEYMATKSYRHSPKDLYNGETITCPQYTEQIVSLLMESPSHKAILMDKRAKSACVGIYYRPGNESETEAFFAVIRTYF